MTQTASAAPLEAWSHRVADVPERGLDVQRSASPAELAIIAEALELTACEHLEATYRLAPAGGGRYRLTGDVAARVVQSCVVTLEPVAQDIAIEIDEEFWPPELLPKSENGLDGEQEALAAVIAEPIRDGRLEAGRVIYEQVATAIDPYPRKEGAELPPEAAGNDDAGGRENPFAVLAKLKPDNR